MDEIKKLKSFYLKILNNLDFGILILNSGFDIKFTNKYFREMFNIVTEIQHKNIFKIDSIKSLFFKKFIERLKDINLYNYGEYKFVLNIGNKCEKDIVTKIFGNLFEEEEEEEEVLITVKDITKIEELNRTVRLMDKFSLVGTLAGGLAHEIKNPLTVIKGYIYILEKELKSKEYLNMMRVISTQTDRILNSINLLLNFAKSSSLEKKRLNLSSIIKNVVIMSTPHAMKNDVRLINEVKESFYIKGIKLELEEVFLNLILNGIEAINHPEGKVIINGEKRWDDRVVISISDNGSGIERNIMKRIFDPFFTTKSKGTGLGLSICYKVIKEYDGDIKIKSEVNKGTTVNVILPLSKE